MFTKFKQAFEHLLTMPGAFIRACNTLAATTDRNTEAVRAMHQELLSTIEGVERHVKYLATSEQHRLRQEGRPHVFEN